MLDSFRAGGFTPSNSEFIYVDNTQANKYDGYSATNRFLHLAHGDYIVLCHQDIRLHADKIEALDRRIDELNTLDPHWAVFGNAEGCIRVAWQFVSPTERRKYSQGQPSVRVASLDENFMVVRRSANLSVSQDLKGFHFYGTDLCVIAISWATPASRGLSFVAYRGRESAEKVQGSGIQVRLSSLKKALIEKYRRAFAPRWIQNTGTVFLFLVSVY